jgi:Holliday junction resolvasome RuvABC endonuclease subunit
MTNILGIDLGLAKMGIVSLRIHDDEIAEAIPTLFETDKKKFKTDQLRWMALCEMAEKKILDTEPDIVVCEFPFGTQGKGKINAETSAVLQRFCFKNHYPFVPVSQASLKKYATGSGRAEKSDMRLWLYEEVGRPPMKDFVREWGEDVSDAYWAAHLGFSIRYGSEKSYRKELAEALKKKHLDLPF